MSATPCRNRPNSAEWILINITEHARNSYHLYENCINGTYNEVFPLYWLTCFETTLVAQLIHSRLTRYITQELRNIVL